MTDDTTQKRPYTRHVHRYNIPVAWKYELGSVNGVVAYTGMQASRLRCECGKEVERK